MKILVTILLAVGFSSVSLADSDMGYDYTGGVNKCPEANTIAKTIKCVATTSSNAASAIISAGLRTGNYVVKRAEQGWKIIVWNPGAHRNDKDNNHRAFAQFFIDELVIEPGSAIWQAMMNSEPVNWDEFIEFNEN